MNTELSPEDANLLENTRKGWTAAFGVIYKGGDIKVGVYKVVADSHEEAVGAAYLWVRGKYTAAEGYGPPELVVDPDPVWIINGVPFATEDADVDQ